MLLFFIFRIFRLKRKTKIKSLEMNTFQAENIRCRQCQVEITAENEPLPRIDYKETEILNLKQQVQNLKGEIGGLKQELDEKDRKL